MSNIINEAVRQQNVTPSPNLRNCVNFVDLNHIKSRSDKPKYFVLHVMLLLRRIAHPTSHQLPSLRESA